MQESESLNLAPKKGKGKNPDLKKVGHNPNKGKDDIVIANNNQSRFDYAHKAGHREYIDEAQVFSEFYRGKQWSDADLKKLNDQGRPALTLNLVLSTVNAIVGEQLDRRVEVRYKPKGHNDEDTAFRINKLTKSILDANRYDELEEAMFADGVIMDRGYVDVRMDFSNNMMGEVSITAEDPIDIIPDPEAKCSDPKNWNEVFITRWMTPDDIEIKYGYEKAERVRTIVSSNQFGNVDNYDFYNQTFGDTVSMGHDHSDTGYKRVRRVRVVERQYYMLTKCQTWVDLDTGDMRDVPQHWSQDDIQAIADRMGWAVIERERRRVRQTISADTTLLHDDWSIYRSFTVIPFFPYFRRGKPFGVVRNLINPQELLNKTSSQELHIVNSTANSGWMFKSGTLVDMGADDLAERGSETGLVLEYTGDAAPQKITAGNIPTGIDRISQKAAQTIRDVSSISTSMLGTGRADQSGKAAEIATNRGQVQVGVVTRSLEKCRRYLGEKVLELVQDFYNETRVFYLCEEGPDGTMDEEEYFINGVDQAGEIIHDVTRGKYTVEVGFAPAGGTEHEKQFTEITQLRELGVAIPDHVMIQYSGLYKRNEIAELLKQQQGFAPPTPEEQEMLAFQQEIEIQRLTLEITDMEATISEKQANAANKMADAESKDGYNIAALELRKLEASRQAKQMELQGRIALAARSHQNSQITNEKRNVTQMALKGLDLAAIEQKPQPASGAK